MAVKKNVIIFYTDQLRADYLGCYGNKYAITTNIDALAQQGIRYENHYSSSPVCMPARASFNTGRTVLANRVYDNGINLPDDEITMPMVFKEAGYATHSYGKLHHQVHVPNEGKQSYEAIDPFEDDGELTNWHGPYYGYDHVELAIGHGEDSWGHYGMWRKKNFPDLKIGEETSPNERKYPDMQVWESGVPVNAHASTWVADRTIDFLKNRDEEKPFFLNVSFPDPHHSFTPPSEYAEKFKDIEFPVPQKRDDEHDDRPLPYRLSMEHASLPFRESDSTKVDPLPSYAVHNPSLKGDAYNMMIAHTHAMMNLVDDSIGRVMDELKQQGLDKNTVIVFTADHGDFLGDHHFFLKALLPSRSLLHIPLIIVDPDRDHDICAEVCSNIDVMPTLLNACNIEIPEPVQGEVLPQLSESMTRKYAFEAAISKGSTNLNHYTIFTKKYKISYFPQLDEGELFDLEVDPNELVNLYNKEEYNTIRDQLMVELCKAHAQAETSCCANTLDGKF